MLPAVAMCTLSPINHYSVVKAVDVGEDDISTGPFTSRFGGGIPYCFFHPMSAFQTGTD